MRKGDIVQVNRLGRSGYLFKDPAYAVVRSTDVGADRQYGIDFIVLSERDNEDLTSYCTHNYMPVSGRAFMALASHLKKPTEDAMLIIVALRAMRGDELVITPEPVSLA